MVFGESDSSAATPPVAVAVGDKPCNACFDLREREPACRGAFRGAGYASTPNPSASQGPIDAAFFANGTEAIIGVPRRMDHGNTALPSLRRAGQ